MLKNVRLHVVLQPKSTCFFHIRFSCAMYNVQCRYAHPFSCCMTGILRVNDTFFVPICIWDWIISITYHSDIVYIFHTLEFVRVLYMQTRTLSIYVATTTTTTTTKKSLSFGISVWLLSLDKFIINEFDKLINVNAVWPQWQNSYAQRAHKQLSHVKYFCFDPLNYSHLYFRIHNHFRWLWFMVSTTA